MKDQVKNIIAFIALVALVASIGCSTYVHRRPVFDQSGQLTGYESTKARSYVSKLDLQALKSRVRDKRGDSDYEREVGLDSAKLAPDAAAIQALGDASVRMAEKAFELGRKSAAGPAAPFVK